VLIGTWAKQIMAGLCNCRLDDSPDRGMCGTTKHTRIN
jgi:hypothetical protein